MFKKKGFTFVIAIILVLALAIPMTACKGDEKKEKETDTKEAEKKVELKAPKEPEEIKPEFSMTVSENKDDDLEVNLVLFKSKDKSSEVVNKESKWQEYPIRVYSPERKQSYAAMNDEDGGIRVTNNDEEGKETRICKGLNVREIYPSGDRLYLIASKDMVYDKPWIYDFNEEALKSISWPDDLSVSSAALSALTNDFYIAAYSVKEQKMADEAHSDNPNQPYAVDNSMYVYNGSEIKRLFVEENRNIDDIVANDQTILYTTSLLGMGENNKKIIKQFDLASANSIDLADDAANLIDGELVFLGRNGNLYVNEFTQFVRLDLKEKTKQSLYSIKGDKYINSVQACIDLEVIKKLNKYKADLELYHQQLKDQEEAKQKAQDEKEKAEKEKKENKDNKDSKDGKDSKDKQEDKGKDSE